MTIDLNQKQLDFILALVCDELERENRYLDDLEYREKFSENQKKILRITHGKNYFKTKTAIKNCERRLNWLSNLHDKVYVSELS